MLTDRRRNSEGRFSLQHVGAGARRAFGPIFASSLAASALMTAVFGLVSLVLLHPGYWINDDLKIIWNIIGYPGESHPIPVMIYSNVLLGLVLDPLYSLRSVMNWEMVLLAIVNLCSMWALLYVALSAKVSNGPTPIALLVILTGIGSLTLNITYTITAVLACLSGSSLLLTAAYPGTTGWKWKGAVGITLLVLGSLIRIQMLALVLVFVLPGLGFVAGSLNLRRLFIAASTAALLVAATYIFDKVYIRLSPEWQAYYTYNAVRQQLHDGHRLSNLHNQIRRVGWTPNDQELFARWFFPDSTVYSLDHLRYLVDHTPGTSQDLSGTIKDFARTIAAPHASPYLFFMLASALSIVAGRSSRTAGWGLLSVWSAALATNLVLAWGYKDPDYVLLSTVAGSIAFGLLLPAWRTDLLHSTATPGQGSRITRLGTLGSLILVAAGAVLILVQSIETSSNNAARQAAYQGILADLGSLQASGKLVEGGLLISPAHGLPYEWSNPFKLEAPPIDYLDTGWITFSPSYERVLRAFTVDSLPDALYRHNNLYLMTESGFTVFLSRYYEEHESINVGFEPIYALPNPSHFAGYDGIVLYQVTQSK